MPRMTQDITYFVKEIHQLLREEQRLPRRTVRVLSHCSIIKTSGKEVKEGNASCCHQE